MSPRLAVLPALAAAALAPSCILHVKGSHSCLRVDGVTLEEKHEEALSVDAWDAAGLTLESALGDVRFEATDGPSRIVATLHEREPGDARLSYEGGVLTTGSESGEPTALGDVTIYVNGELPSLHAETGSGDVAVHGLRVAGDLWLSTGLGDVDVVDSAAGAKVSVSSGMGDVTLRGVDAPSVAAGSGMGDVSLRRVTGKDADLGSGMGDVTLTGCSFEHVDAETGMGDVACRETTYGTADLHTGLGSVRR